MDRFAEVAEGEAPPGQLNAEDRAILETYLGDLAGSRQPGPIMRGSSSDDILRTTVFHALCRSDFSSQSAAFLLKRDARSAGARIDIRPPITSHEHASC